MQNSKLIKVLKTLSPKEIRHFRKFINSPFYNQRTDIIQLFENLFEFVFELQMIPDKKKLYQKIYSKEIYDDQQMRLLISYSHKHLEKFLIHQSYFLDEVKNRLKLSQIYRDRNLPKLSRKNLQEAQKLQQKLPIRNAEYYNDYSQILLEQYQFSSTESRIGEQNLQEISDNIDIAYFTLKLRQTCFSLSHQAVYKTDYQLGMLSEMIQYIEQQKLLNIPAIAVYYYGYYTLIQPKKVDYFYQLKSILFQNANHFPLAEIRDLFLLAVNCCIKRLNQGDKRFEKEMLDLYKEGLQKEYLMTNGILSRFTYQNATTIGLIQQDYEWVEKFNHDYKDRLEKQYQENSYYFNMARLGYARKNYTSVFQLLKKADFKDLLLNIAAKTIALKSYYELQEISLLESHMDAMKNFIRRKKIIGYHKENYLNLIRFVKQLLELKRFDKKACQDLYEKIEATKAVAEKAWLLQQLN